jgi:hypothetical protein
MVLGHFFDPLFAVIVVLSVFNGDSSCPINPDDS